MSNLTSASKFTAFTACVYCDFQADDICEDSGLCADCLDKQKRHFEKVNRDEMAACEEYTRMKEEGNNW